MYVAPRSNMKQDQSSGTWPADPIGSIGSRLLNGVALRLAWLSDYRRSGLLATMMMVMFAKVLFADDNTPCVYAQCQCFFWSNHFVLGPVGCQYNFPPIYGDCWSH